MQRLGLAGRASGYRAISLWAEVAGPEIARRTFASRFVDDVLYVDVDSPAWASQLTFVRQALIDRLNARLAAGGVVRDIRFRPRGSRRTVAGEAPLTGLALVRSRFRTVAYAREDEESAAQLTGPDEEAAAALRKLFLTHRRLEVARSMSGWERCPRCGRTRERAAGECPCRGEGSS
ncbi:MAG: DUF721 domain-containing protein [Firmicutes bacterium]|nr:DUF721 domain-containing protein [Bacillota bacterium]